MVEQKQNQAIRRSRQNESRSRKLHQDPLENLESVSKLNFTMSKRELSSTLKSLKFMQRASQREAQTSNKVEEQVEEVKPSGDFPSTSVIKRRCVVIVEGDTQPEAARGRMSFLSFNPSIDKLNGEESNPSQNESSAANSSKQSETNSENGSPIKKLDKMEVEAFSNGNGDLKRKQADTTMEPSSGNKSKKGSKSSSPNGSHSSQKHRKQEKLDYNVLRPPKYPSKMR